MSSHEYALLVFCAGVGVMLAIKLAVRAVRRRIKKASTAEFAQRVSWTYDARAFGYRDQTGKLVADLFGNPIS